MSNAMRMNNLYVGATKSDLIKGYRKYLEDNDGIDKNGFYKRPVIHGKKYTWSRLRYGSPYGIDRDTFAEWLHSRGIEIKEYKHNIGDNNENEIDSTDP